jgi:hypothetical protein
MVDVEKTVSFWYSFAGEVVFLAVLVAKASFFSLFPRLK